MRLGQLTSFQNTSGYVSCLCKVPAGVSRRLSAPAGRLLNAARTPTRICLLERRPSELFNRRKSAASNAAFESCS